MAGPTTLCPRGETITQADIGKCAAHHDFVVTAARAIGVEVGLFDPVRLEVCGCRTVFGDATCRGDMVGRDRIAEQGEYSCTLDVADRRGFLRHAFEVRRVLHVGRVRLPRIDIARR